MGTFLQILVVAGGIAIIVYLSVMIFKPHSAQSIALQRGLGPAGYRLYRIMYVLAVVIALALFGAIFITK